MYVRNGVPNLTITITKTAPRKKMPTFASVGSFYKMRWRETGEGGICHLSDSLSPQVREASNACAPALLANVPKYEARISSNLSGMLTVSIVF